MHRFSIAVHGGAGTISRNQLSAKDEALYRQGLLEAVQAGYDLLASGESAIDAVLKATIILEDNPLFNAGRGSVFNSEGMHEMDAAIMDGSNLSAGAIAAIQHIRNPIKVALEVMRNSDHVFLIGQGANEFARLRGFEEEKDEYFFSQFRYDQWQNARRKDKVMLDHSQNEPPHTENKFGTVGAVACDQAGQLAAATSTGGMTNKKFGRVGDSPIIGAGTYANNETCAISCTGHGEPFIRAVTAYDISALMEYHHMGLQEAMNRTIQIKLKMMGGEGGAIGVNNRGEVAMIFNSEGMYRGFKSSDGKEEIAIYK